MQQSTLGSSCIDTEMLMEGYNCCVITSLVCSCMLLIGLAVGGAATSHTLMLPSPHEDTRMFSFSCTWIARACVKEKQWSVAACMTHTVGMSSSLMPQSEDQKYTGVECGTILLTRHSHRCHPWCRIP